MSIPMETNTDELRDVLQRILNLPLYKELPSLTNPASAGDILEGMEIINTDGSVVIGTIPKRTSSNLTVSGATVSVPSGYYASATSKSVSTATQATPSISFADTTGKITASVTQSTGYVTGGTKTAEYTLDVKDNSDLTASGATVTVPKGYYTSNTSKSVSTATQATPSISVDSSTGLITASATQSAGYVSAGTKSSTNQLTTQAAQTITPGTTAKYIESGRYLIGRQTISAIQTETKTATANGTYTPSSGKYFSSFTVNIPVVEQATPSITVSTNGLITASATQEAGQVVAGTKSGTKQLTTQAAKTITPSTSSQTAVTSGVYTTGAITVAAIPSTYVQPTATKSATTYTPTTSNQTIAAGTYCSGVQTIKGDSNLKAANIVKGVSIFGVSGSHQCAAGLDTSDATATASDILSGKTAYVKGSKVTGNIATRTSSNLSASGATVTVPAGYYASQSTKSVTTATQATPSISVNTSGLITASATQSAGYVSAGTKSATSQLTTQAAQTITPGTSNKTIASGRYLTGTQTIQGDSNLKAENIKEGVSIFNVTGTFKGGMAANFEIVTYSSESALMAASPSNNTIGVVTTTPISSWVFSTSTPSSPSSNMLWIETGKQGTVELNLVTTNGIIVYPLNAKQYINGAWVKVPAYNRQSGQWVSWIHDLIYYNNGQTDLTNSLTYKSVTVNANGYLNFSLGTNGNAYANTPIINLSGMQLVELDYSNLSGSNTFAGGMSIRILATDGTTVIKNTTRSTSTAKTLTLDISDLDGEYIVQAYGNNTSGSYSGSARVKTLKVLTSASAASVAEAKAAAYDILVGDN